MIPARLLRHLLGPFSDLNPAELKTAVGLYCIFL